MCADVKKLRQGYTSNMNVGFNKRTLQTSYFTAIIGTKHRLINTSIMRNCLFGKNIMKVTSLDKALIAQAIALNMILYPYYYPRIIIWVLSKNDNEC